MNKSDSKFGMKLVFGAIALSILIFIVGLFAVYYADDIKKTAADEHSVPPPTAK